MGKDDADPNDIEFLDVGPAPRSDRAGQQPYRGLKWAPLLLAGILAAVVVTALVHRGGKPSAAHPPRPSTTNRPLSSVAPPSTPGPSAPSAAPVAVTEVGHPLLGVTAGWELFGRGVGVVVRIQFARGRITRTTVPDLRSSGPVYFVVGRDEALVRPLDFVPGYLVPDGDPNRQVSATLSLGQAGPVYPGPDLNHVWLPSEGGNSADIGLTGLDDTRPGVLLPVPAGGSVQQAIPDGAGYLLFTGLGGTYDSRPDGLHRVTIGTVLAVGPTRWLVSECNARDACTTAVIDRARGTRHTLRRVASDTNPLPVGVISPDGTTAAVIDGSNQAIQLRDLRSGADHPVSVLTNPATLTDGSLVWSPDSRWLFIATAHGYLAVVDARTRHVRDIGARLPNLSQLAIRNVATK